MKKWLWGIIYFLSMFLSTGYADLGGGLGTTIYTNNADTVFVDEFLDESKNPIRQGIDGLVHNIGGIFRPQAIDNFDQAKDTTIDVIKMFINYALGLVSLIALIYLLAHGFIVMTAMGDDSKTKKGFAGIKTAAIALAGIALSRSLVTFIFFIINLITS